MKELGISPEEQIQVLEALKPKIGRFVKEKLYSWGLGQKDILLVDEAGFGYTGIPIYGPELRAATDWGKAHIDIAVRESLYTGPRGKVEHPLKITLPPTVIQDISTEYGIGVWDLIKGRNFFELPTQTVRLGDTEVLVPEPVSHVRAFAHDTILYYSLEQVGQDKILEWFDKLNMIRNISRAMCKPEVMATAEEMIAASLNRWSFLEQG